MLFYRLLASTCEEMLPIVYTPTVGRGDRALQPRVPPPARGVPVDRPPGPDRAVVRATSGSGADDVDLIVATDAEDILGIGDWGVGGIEIADRQAGRLHRRGRHRTRAGSSRSCWTSAPTTRRCSTTRCTSATGTPRVRGRALRRLHRRLRHAPPRGCSRTRCCTGRTSAPSNARRILRAVPRPDAAPSTTTCRAPARSCSPPRWRGVRVAGTPMRDQRIVIFGAGTAGRRDRRPAARRDGPRRARRATRPPGGSGCVGPAGPAHRRHGRPARLPGALRPAGRRGRRLGRADGGRHRLAEVVAPGARRPCCIGTSTRPGAFTEQIVRGHGRARRAADHLPDVQPDVAGSRPCRPT